MHSLKVFDQPATVTEMIEPVNILLEKTKMMLEKSR